MSEQQYAVFEDTDNGGYPQNLLGVMYGTEENVKVVADAMYMTRHRVVPIIVTRVSHADAARARDYLARRQNAIAQLKSAQETISEKFSWPERDK